MGQPHASGEGTQGRSLRSADRRALGAFLGFHAAAGLLAVVSTIVGAAVGANLILLVLDISWDRQVRDPSVESVVTERLEPRPSIG